MKVQQPSPFLSCTLEELIARCIRGGSSIPNSDLAGVAAKLSGQCASASAKIAVGAADQSGGLIYFSNRELLVRFLQISPKAQEDLLRSMRNWMYEFKVTEMQIPIPWSKEASRLLKVNTVDPEDLKCFGGLEFSLI